MNKFAQRSYQAELLDREDINREDLFQNLRELDLINRYLGGHNVTIAGIKPLLSDRKRTYHIADIGCGGGDSMIALAAWGRKNGFKFRLTGVDIKPDVIEYASEFCRHYPEISFVQSDYRDLATTAAEPVDIFMSSLFCHHLNDEQLVGFLSYIHTHATLGFVINDLHRHRIAYYSIMAMTRALNGSVLVQNDAPLSVLRGFSRSELETYLQQAGVKEFELQWKFAFRYLITAKSGRVNG